MSNDNQQSHRESDDSINIQQQVYRAPWKNEQVNETKKASLFAI